MASPGPQPVKALSGGEAATPVALAAAPITSEATPLRRRFCESCGAERKNAEARFCEQCGADVG